MSLIRNMESSSAVLYRTMHINGLSTMSFIDIYICCAQHNGELIENRSMFYCKMFDSLSEVQCESETMT